MILETIAGWLLKIYEASPRFMAVLCISCAALLFLPYKILASLSLDGFVSHNRPWISLAFLFSSLVTLSYPIEHGWRASHKYVMTLIFWQRIKNRLEKLDPEEKNILSRYVTGKTKTQTFFFDNGAVANLRLCRILFIPVTRYEPHRVPHSINERVFDYLREHPELLK